jgi:hypothetical protein
MAPPANTKPIVAWLPPDLTLAVALYAAHSKRSFSDAAGLLVTQYFQTVSPESQQAIRAGGLRAAEEERRKQDEPLRAFEEKSAAKAREVAAEIGARRQAEESLNESLALIAHIAGRWTPGTFPVADASAREQLDDVRAWLAARPGPRE